MKKINFLLLTIGFLIISSCSSDKSDPAPENPAPTNVVSAKVSGVDVTFDKVVIVKEVYPTYVDLAVTATNTVDADKKMIFKITQNTMDADACFYWSYTKPGFFYSWNSEMQGATFTVITTTNSTSVLKGTFSGILIDTDASQSVPVTNGIISVTY
jgi:hypothetical protein